MKTKFNQTVIQKTSFFVFHIFIYNSIFAQIEAVSKLKSHEIFSPQKLYLFPFSTDLQLNYSYDSTYRSYSTPTNKSFELNANKPFTTASFNQIKTEDFAPGLGSYEFYNNKFAYRINHFIIADFGIGLARQNSILYAAKPNYQIGFQASLEFEVTSKLDAFIYGQYFTSPINKSKDFFDPLIYKNPFFLQSEMGAGIKKDYKNMNAKFQINSIYDNNTKQFTPVNSNISIGF
jgi:hypothetical protein